MRRSDDSDYRFTLDTDEYGFRLSTPLTGSLAEARGVTPLALARARPPARAISRARSSRARGKRRAALPARDSGLLIGFPLGVPDAPSAPARASSGVRGVGAGRSAARAPGGAPISPARHARCIRALRARPLAGNAALPAPGLSCPGRACAAGGTPHASGALRALHITRALCARVRAVARTNSRARGLDVSACREVRALERGREEVSRAPSARASVGASRTVLRFARGICAPPSCGARSRARHGSRRAGQQGREPALARCARGAAARGALRALRALPAWHERAACVGRGPQPRRGPQTYARE
jgi:hypothetical protein